jgi:hypothetical protein
MKFNDWKNVAELIGIAAIVASLIFVGLQLKQSQEIAIADQYQNRADAALEFYHSRLQSDYAISILANDLKREVDSGMAPAAMEAVFEAEGAELLAARYLAYRSNITVFDNYHFQYERGFMGEDAWQAFRVRLKDILSNDIDAALYKQMRLHFRPSFRTVCEKIIAELEAESASQRDFQRLLLAESSHSPGDRLSGWY